MRKILLLLILELSSNLYSQQDGFQYATTDTNKIDYYIKPQSNIEDTIGLYTEFWLRYNNPNKKVKTKTGKYVNITGNITLSLMKISCIDKTVIIKNSLEYDSNGNLVKQDNPSMAEQPIPPGSVIDNIYKILCPKE